MSTSAQLTVRSLPSSQCRAPVVSTHEARPCSNASLFAAPVKAQRWLRSIQNIGSCSLTASNNPLICFLRSEIRFRILLPPLTSLQSSESKTTPSTIKLSRTIRTSSGGSLYPKIFACSRSRRQNSSLNPISVSTALNGSGTHSSSQSVKA